MVHSTAKRLAREGKTSSSRGRGERGGGRGGKKRGGGSSRGGGGGGGGGRPVKEVVWDEDARREFLTGFSKRKKEKKEAAQARALEKQKEEKLQMRQQIRDARREQAASNVAMAKEYYGGVEADLPSGEEGDLEPAEPEEQEYANEEMTSRVVIQDFNMDEESDDERRDNVNIEEEEEEEGGEGDETVEQMEDLEDDENPNANMFAILAPKPKPKPTVHPVPSINKGKRRGKPNLPDARSIMNEAPVKEEAFATPNDSPDKKVPKKFTYESKAARRLEAAKQKARRMEKAEYSKSGRGGKSGRGMVKKRRS